MFIGPNGDRRNPAAQEEMLRNTERSVIAGTGEEEWLEPMRTVCLLCHLLVKSSQYAQVIAIWRGYLREPEVLDDTQKTRQCFRTHYTWISQAVADLRNPIYIFEESIPTIGTRL